MLTALFLVACVVFENSNAYSATFYDSFSGNRITNEEVKIHVIRNTTYWCTNEVEPCDPSEGRRIDGSCNNLKYPSVGAIHTPTYRLLPPVYDVGYEPKRAKSGAMLPPIRPLRTSLLLEGRVPDLRFTQLVAYYMVFMSADILSFHDTVNYLNWKPYCCEKKGKTDPECIPISIPDDDPVHRFSDQRCFNLTRPWTFQNRGCIHNNSPPERIISSTTTFDLSQIYGNLLRETNTQVRAFTNGLLLFEVENGRIWPPSSKRPFEVCIANQRPHETRCHAIADDSTNGVFGTNFFVIMFWRLHNVIASNLARINPCWDDERLFYTARDINIAIATQIFYYELNPTLMGRENLERDRVISYHEGFRDVYNENLLPQLSAEYTLVLRWAHTMQEGVMHLYDKDGNYVKDMRIANLTLRTGYLGVGDNMDYMTQGSFRQAGAKVDYTVDPDIGETGLGTLQKIADLPSSDLSKNRHFGMQPYTKYREFCFGDTFKTFDDLLHVIDQERVEKLKEMYEHVDDIDLLAGVWVEKLIPGGYVPETFYFMTVEQLLRIVRSDRHWYERPNRPHAFTIEQLAEIRKASMARLLCDVGDTVSHIQPRAFLLAGPGNEMVSCKQIKKLNYRAWKDETCQSNYKPNTAV
ncbi:peroxidase-like [Epargyreus clarus]|uniref:peroxidase-like n=1 Tax=Epargyreus clarus TaxID=520877 RepID=UPI003C2E89F2